MDNVVILANLMTDESRKACKSNRFTRSEELEGTILLKYKTIDTLKELSHNENQTYDQIIEMLVLSYRKHKDDDGGL